MSVDILDLMVGDGVDAEEWVTQPPFHGAVSLPVQAARDADLWVGKEPLNENPYHGEVWRSPNGGNFTGSQVKALRNAADWFVPIEGVELP